MAVVSAPRVTFSIELYGSFQPTAPIAEMPGPEFSVVARIIPTQPHADIPLYTAINFGRASLYINNATQSARISALSQQLVAENIVNLFTLDLSKFGAGLARFATDVDEHGQPIRWGGEAYYPTAVEASGFERKAGGTAARPTLTMGNVNKLITSLIIEGKDLVGCEVRRYRTFRRFLDDGAEPSTTDHFPAEIYRVERLKGRNKLTAEFELASILDQEGTKIPKRQILRDYCSFVYRRWDAEAGAWKIDVFDPCPYAGGAMFDRKGNVVDAPAKDVCGKRIRDCKLRFGEHERLYTRAFPGVARVK